MASLHLSVLCLSDQRHNSVRASRPYLVAFALSPVRLVQPGIKTRVEPTRRVSTGSRAGFCKNSEGLRVGAEGVVPFDFSGEPPVAKALTRAPPASAPRLFSDGHGSRVTERSSPGVQADTRHHARHAPGRGSRLA